MSDGGSAVQVAVRVRLFNGREKAMGSKVGVDMSENTTFVWSEEVAAAHEAETGENLGTNGPNPCHRPLDDLMDPNQVDGYAFDYSLWSHCVPKGVDNPCPQGWVGGTHCEGREDRVHIDQQALYDTIGTKLLRDFWGPNNNGYGGFDCCLFAYGQSGAGKSFSMTGAGPRCPPHLAGMIPRLSKNIFDTSDTLNADPKYKCTVKAFMHEIYLNEVYDLLVPGATDPLDRDKMSIIGGRPVNPKTRDFGGIAVANVEDVAKVLIKGFSNQTKAPTGLNVDSSRGHTIFSLNLEIKESYTEKGRKKIREIQKSLLLVDLAGSERSDKVASITARQLYELKLKVFWVEENHPEHEPAWTEKNGLAYDQLTEDQRLDLMRQYRHPIAHVDEQYLAAYKAERKTEGNSINQSLSNLGNIVKKVGELSSIANMSKRKKAIKSLSWRTDKLTQLLQRAVGGDCKTLMIAAISPSCTENPETISTLRYAKQIKEIKSNAVAQEKALSNEEKLMIQLEEMKAAMAAMQAAAGGAPSGGGGGGGGGMTEEEKAAIEAERAAAKREATLLRQEMEMLKQQAEANQEGSAEWKAREAAIAEREAKLKAEFAAQDAQRLAPHLVMLTQNPMTSGLYLSVIPPDRPLYAGQGDEKEVELKLRGVGVRPLHARFEQRGTQFFCIPHVADAQIMINGSACTAETQIFHNDRLRLATQNFFRFIDPSVSSQKTPDENAADDSLYTFEYIKEEAMRETMAAMEQDDDDKKARDAKLMEDLKKREDDLKKAQAEMLAQQAEYERKHKQEMESLEAKLAAAAGNAAEQERLQRELDAKAAQLERKLNSQRANMELKTRQEEEYQQALKEQHEAEERHRKAFREKLHHDLLDCLPAVSQANQWAQELQLPLVYTCKVVMKKQPSGATFPVTTVQLENTDTSQVERWSMEDFQDKFQIMHSQFPEFHEAVSKGENPGIPFDSPFKVNIHSQQSIGTASVFLQYVYFNMELEENFNIISGVTGSCSGHLEMKVTPLWQDHEREAVDHGADTLHDIPDLSRLDLELHIVQCNSLPEQFASDVVVKFEFPPHIHYAILPPNFDRSRTLTQEEKRKMGRRGGVIETPVAEHNVDVLNRDPMIDFKINVRLLDLNFRGKEWFKNATLLLEVFGEPPNLLMNDAERSQKLLRAKTQRTAVAANIANTPYTQPGPSRPMDNSRTRNLIKKLHDNTETAQKFTAQVLGDKKRLQANLDTLVAERKTANQTAKELEQELATMEAELQLARQQKSSMQDSLSEETRQRKLAQKKEEMREAELRALRQQSDGPNGSNVSAEMERLKRDLEQALAEAQKAKQDLANAKSSSCSVM
jgi:hypothetical protein